jgi:hypothetical protein
VVENPVAVVTPDRNLVVAAILVATPDRSPAAVVTPVRSPVVVAIPDRSRVAAVIDNHSLVTRLEKSRTIRPALFFL